MVVLNPDSCVTLLGAAAMNPLVPVLATLQAPQVTMGTLWTAFAAPFW